MGRGRDRAEAEAGTGTEGAASREAGVGGGLKSDPLSRPALTSRRPSITALGIATGLLGLLAVASIVLPAPSWETSLWLWAFLVACVVWVGIAVWALSPR